MSNPKAAQTAIIGKSQSGETNDMNLAGYSFYLREAMPVILQMSPHFHTELYITGCDFCLVKLTNKVIIWAEVV